MKAICLRKSLSHGKLRLVRDQVSDEIPGAIGIQWVAAGYIREIVEPATEPTERSICPATMTSSIPSAMIIT